MAGICLEQLLKTSQLDWHPRHGRALSRLRLPAADINPEAHLNRPSPRIITLSKAGAGESDTPVLALICGGFSMRQADTVTAQSVIHTPEDADSAYCALAMALAGHADLALNQYHATLVRLHGQGILISGPPGSGKSTLALALIREAGAALVADDCVDIRPLREAPAGCSPALLRHYLHSPELGALDIACLFGQTRVVTACQIDLGVKLTPAPASRPAIVDLNGNWQQQELAGMTIPTLCLAAHHTQAVTLIDLAARMTAMGNVTQAMADILQQRQQQAIQDEQA